MGTPYMQHVPVPISYLVPSVTGQRKEYKTVRVARQPRRKNAVARETPRPRNPTISAIKGWRPSGRAFAQTHNLAVRFCENLPSIRPQMQEYLLKLDKYIQKRISVRRVEMTVVSTSAFGVFPRDGEPHSHLIRIGHKENIVLHANSSRHDKKNEFDSHNSLLANAHAR